LIVLGTIAQIVAPSSVDAGDKLCKTAPAPRLIRFKRAELRPEQPYSE
jgi:hypothetical protein